MEAEKRGIAGERLIFAPKIELPHHLARHRLADLFLDTLPCNAHTTASDALWAGLPLLTCLGTTFAGRVSASLLKAVGLPDMVARTLFDYEAFALELAHNPDVLDEVKSRLSQNLALCPLFDTKRFTSKSKLRITRFGSATLKEEGLRVSRSRISDDC